MRVDLEDWRRLIDRYLLEKNLRTARNKKVTRCYLLHNDRTKKNVVSLKRS